MARDMGSDSRPGAGHGTRAGPAVTGWLASRPKTWVKRPVIRSAPLYSAELRDQAVTTGVGGAVMADLPQTAANSPGRTPPRRSVEARTVRQLYALIACPGRALRPARAVGEREPG